MATNSSADSGQAINLLLGDLRLLEGITIQLEVESRKLPPPIARRADSSLAPTEAEEAYARLLSTRALVKQRIVETMQIPAVVAYLRQPGNETLRQVCAKAIQT